MSEFVYNGAYRYADPTELSVRRLSGQAVRDADLHTPRSASVWTVALVPSPTTIIKFPLAAWLDDNFVAMKYLTIEVLFLFFTS